MSLLFLLDQDQKVLSIIDNLISGTEKNIINASNELDVEIPFNQDNQTNVDKARYLVIASPNATTDKITDTHLYTIASYTTSYTSISITSYETVYDELKDTWAVKLWGILYCDELLTQLIDFLPNPKTWDISSVPPQTDYEPMAYEEEDTSVSDVISKAIENWGFEFDFTFDLTNGAISARHIHVYEKMGTDQKDLKFDMKRDFKDCKYTKDYSGVYTALVGYGATYKVENGDTPTPDNTWQNYYVDGTIKIIVPSAVMVNRELQPYSGRQLALDSEWRTDMYMYRASDQSKYYRVSTDQYVESGACTFTGTDNNDTGDDSGTDTEDPTEYVTDFTQVEWTAGTNPVDKPKGQGYVEIPDASAAYGYYGGQPRIGIAKFSDEVSSERLLSRTYEKLLTTCYPLVKFESSFNNFPSGISLGDTIYIFEENLNVYVEERITEIDLDLVDVSNSKLTVGETFALTPEQRYSGLPEYARKNYIKYV